MRASGNGAHSTQPPIETAITNSDSDPGRIVDLKNTLDRPPDDVASKSCRSLSNNLINPQAVNSEPPMFRLAGVWSNSARQWIQAQVIAQSSKALGENTYVIVEYRSPEGKLYRKRLAGNSNDWHFRDENPSSPSSGDASATHTDLPPRLPSCSAKRVERGPKTRSKTGARHQEKEPTSQNSRGGGLLISQMTEHSNMVKANVEGRRQDAMMMRSIPKTTGSGHAYSGGFVRVEGAKKKERTMTDMTAISFEVPRMLDPSFPDLFQNDEQIDTPDIRIIAATPSAEVAYADNKLLKSVDGTGSTVRPIATILPRVLLTKDDNSTENETNRQNVPAAQDTGNAQSVICKPKPKKNTKKPRSKTRTVTVVAKSSLDQPGKVTTVRGVPSRSTTDPPEQCPIRTCVEGADLNAIVANALSASTIKANAQDSDVLRGFVQNGSRNAVLEHLAKEKVLEQIAERLWFQMIRATAEEN